MGKVNVMASIIDMNGNERAFKHKSFDNRDLAEEYVATHEQDFADDPSIYKVWIEEDKAC